eukprot:GILI01009849.1.p1 GENE.GILI01009849.1~~GILI01009849.1.p1  ORF type:complete len:307 (-),score=90.48 GILI01009849.1:260-1180(-)
MQAQLAQRRKQELYMMDPMNPEVQRMIQEEILQEQVDRNLEMAQEYLPESFGRVTMLYISIEVNKHPIKAFVDSGAQSTIMSLSCAERCGLSRLIDRRFAGIAVGVGTSTIVGKVHMAPLKVGDNFYSCSFTILEDNKVDFLFGLDMLKRFQCCIDLKASVLRFGDGAEVPFLAEKDIPTDHFNASSPSASPLPLSSSSSSPPSSSSSSSSSRQPPDDSASPMSTYTNPLATVGASASPVLVVDPSLSYPLEPTYGSHPDGYPLYQLPVGAFSPVVYGDAVSDGPLGSVNYVEPDSSTSSLPPTSA